MINSKEFILYIPFAALTILCHSILILVKVCRIVKIRLLVIFLRIYEGKSHCLVKLMTNSKLLYQESSLHHCRSTAVHVGSMKRLFYYDLCVCVRRNKMLVSLITVLTVFFRMARWR